MNAQNLILKCFFFCSFLVNTGCAIKFSDYEVPIISSANDQTSCPYSTDPKTYQARELCRALQRVDQRRSELAEEVTKSPSTFLDYSQLGLALLGAGALAADSHISVLEGLGIVTAGVVGFKAYSNDQARHSIYALGMNGLTCIKASSSHLLWDDRWYFRMRYYRYALVNSNSNAASLADSASAPLQDKYKNLSEIVRETLTLADKATLSYSAIASVVDGSLINIVNEAQKREYASRADASEIASKILNAQAIKRQENEALDKESEDLQKTAASNTPTTTAASNAMSIVEAKITTEVNKDIASSTTMKDVDPTKAVTMLAGTTTDEKMAEALAVMAKSVQEITYIAPRYIKSVNETAACSLQ